MWAGNKGEQAVCEKGCKYSWGKCSPPFLSFEATKPSAATRVNLFIFHPLGRVRLVRMARRDI